MKETEHQRKTVDITRVKAVRCDRCSNDLGVDEHGTAREGTSFSLSFGYGSRFDLSDWYFDICDDCAEWLKGEFSTAEIHDHGWSL
ncbi:MAG TPA: hypothetical protein VKE92_08615 [Anaerolineales bacterium]|nr:hypothetical protein [Anaerolineales bacterium]